ncbi:MAG: type I restriction enzyme HsdR N-terminal domain-containing protein [Candidatus Methylomirabilis sp.]|nr:type I restriction enzyme HsdR N-terminal domain-containing protein [Candidatus Methylomirabilis sp.]
MVPKRVQDRLVRSLAKFQQVIKIAKDRDVNESDTVSIIRDTLAEVFGYDKHLDITSEFAVRGTYCDLAIKNDGKVEYLIEAKAIGLDLKDSHLRQAIEYGANKGVQWVILTNADSWQVYKIRFEQPIAYDLVCAFNFLDLNPKNDEHLEMLFVVCKEGLAKDAREEFHEKDANRQPLRPWRTHFDGRRRVGDSTRASQAVGRRLDIPRGNMQGSQG